MAIINSACTSRISWPQQQQPPKESWAEWATFINEFTLNSTTKHLKTHLGPWLPTIGAQRNWHYRYHHHLIEPYITNSEQQIWILIDTTRTQQQYKLQEQLATETQCNAPYIPVFPIQIVPTLTLEIPRRTRYQPLFPREPEDKEPWYDNLTEQAIAIHETSFQDLVQAEIVEICTQGSYHRHNVTCGWTLSANALTLYQGKAKIVPTKEDSDIRGTLLGAIDGITIYLETYRQHQCPIPNQCINIWTTQRKLEKMFEPAYDYQLTTASKQFNQENELIRTLKTLIKSIPKCKVTYIKPKTTDITLEHITQQILNCQRHATNAHRFFPKPIHISSPSHRATLYIADIEVPTNTKNQLTYAATSPALRTHFTKKYEWKSQTIDDIDWQTHSRALLSTNRSNKKTITQFIHRWLPTHSSPSTSTTLTPFCPICLSVNETHDHFLTCQDTDSIAHWMNQAESFLQQTAKLEIDPILKYYMYLAITQWRNTPNPPRPEFCKGLYKNLFKRQSHIGWDQILAGRLTKDWVDIRNESDQFQQLKGLKIITSAVSIIMNIISDTWKFRCDHKYGKNETKDKAFKETILFPKINELYEARHTLLYQDKLYFRVPYQHIQNQSSARIQECITKTTIFITGAQQRAKEQDSTQQNIQQYFTASTPTRESIRQRTSPRKSGSARRRQHEQRILSQNTNRPLTRIPSTGSINATTSDKAQEQPVITIPLPPEQRRLPVADIFALAPPDPEPPDIREKEQPLLDRPP